MATSLSSLIPSESFFAPLAGLAEKSIHARNCNEISDAQWIQIGVTRIINDPTSGRGFLQQVAALLSSPPTHSNFFENLKSDRRLSMVADVNMKVAAKLSSQGQEHPQLANYAIYAGDGHWHAAACHDAPIDDRRWAVGHLYALDFRTHALRHIDLTEGKREHDMSVIKRQGAKCMRLNEATGRKVLWVWDRAVIDFLLWQHWKQTSGIYFLTRTKEKLILTVNASRLFDRNDPINYGVQSDELVSTGPATLVRRVTYRDPASSELFEFITTVFDVPPGVIASLFKRRWDIEKVFDEIKNKLNESKAWATSPIAKKMQAHFICLAHNLLELLARRLSDEHHINDEAGLRRRKKRLEQQKAAAAKNGRILSSLLTASLRPLQRSIKLIRWLRSHWFSSAPLAQFLPRLKRLYAVD